MKTKNKITLLAFTAMLSAAHNSLAEIPATPPIDSLILQVMATGNISSGPLCGGMDDDQIVGGGGAISTAPAPDATNQYTSSQSPYDFRSAQPGSSFTSVQYPYALIAGGNGNDTFSPPVNRGLISDPLSICGGNGNDSLVAGAGAGADPAGIIVGGVGIDYLRTAGASSFYADSTGAWPLTNPATSATSQIVTGTGLGGGPHITGDLGNDLLVDRQILQLMTTGSFCGDGMDGDDLHGNDGDDTLWGDNGTDSLHVQSGAHGLWLGGGTDELIYGETGSDSLYGGNGADTIKRAPATSSFVFGTTSY